MPISGASTRIDLVREACLLILQVVPDEGLCIEEYSEFRALGRVALRDGGKTVAVGIVTRILQTKQLI